MSFGSQSQHLGPPDAAQLPAAGRIDPDNDFKRVASRGAHDATIAAVATGKVDAGALNISVWEKFVADKKVDPAQVKVFYTTPPYYDYNWTVHADMPAALREKLAKAFLALDPDSAGGQGDPRAAARHPLRADQGRELQGHRSRGRERAAC